MTGVHVQLIEEVERYGLFRIITIEGAGIHRSQQLLCDVPRSPLDFQEENNTAGQSKNKNKRRKGVVIYRTIWAGETTMIAEELLVERAVLSRRKGWRQQVS
jgi:hypothetical protein